MTKTNITKSKCFSKTNCYWDIAQINQRQRDLCMGLEILLLIIAAKKTAMIVNIQITPFIIVYLWFTGINKVV